MTYDYRAQNADELQEEVDAVEEFQRELEDFVFLEETATAVMAKARQLAQRYPELRDMSRFVQDGLQDFHHQVLHELSEALSETDEVLQRKVDAIDEIRRRGPGSR